MLNYDHERILETYYAMRLLKGLTRTFDYQYTVNPAYNADRGPISFFSGRLTLQASTLFTGAPVGACYSKQQNAENDRYCGVRPPTDAGAFSGRQVCVVRS
jgi:hypothetical protein